MWAGVRAGAAGRYRRWGLSYLYACWQNEVIAVGCGSYRKGLCEIRPHILRHRFRFRLSRNRLHRRFCPWLASVVAIATLDIFQLVRSFLDFVGQSLLSSPGFFDGRFV